MTLRGRGRRRDAHRELLVRRPDAAGDETRLVGVLARVLVGGTPGQLDGLRVHLDDVILEVELPHRERVAVEGVGLDDVGAGLEVGAMDLLDDRRAG